MITTQQVADWMGLSLSGATADEVAALDAVVSAVNAYVNSLPNIDKDFTGGWADTTYLGARMLASRLYKRRNSPGGVEAAGDTRVFVSRYDSDIARLLKIDGFGIPEVG